MTGRVTAVVFDIGGVLLDWDPRHLYERLLSPQETDWFLQTICTPQWHAPNDLGANTEAACRSLAEQWPEHAGLIWAWYERGEEMVRGTLPAIEVLRRLHGAGVPCYGLTNMEAETFPKRRDRYEFMGWFDGIVVSGFEGVAKPDPRLFSVLAERYGLNPSETVFIDDRATNVTAAARLGFRTMRFFDHEQLVADLATIDLEDREGRPVRLDDSTAGQISS